MRWLDEAYVRWVPRPTVFPDGWGDLATVETPLDPALRDTEPEPATITWTRARAHGRTRRTEGWFESPDTDLPPEARVARVKRIEPRDGPAKGTVVVLAAWGDEGFSDRSRLVARAVEQGVTALLLENPFYGQRRRVGQRGARLRTVADFVAMGRATVLEARSLMAWARAQRYPRVGVAGFSMGGQMAGLGATLVPWPVRAVLVASAISPARVFFDGPLHVDVRRAPLGPGGLERLRDVMESISLLDVPPPRDPALARLVGTRADGIVPPGDTGAIARHWGAPARYLEDGHVSAMVLRPHAMGQAIADAFA